MSVLTIVRVIAILSSGLSAGIIFGDRMGNSFARPSLSAAEFIRFQKIQNIYFARMMPVVLLTAIGSGLAWLIRTRADWNSPQCGLVALATAAMIAGVLLTGTVNVPINKQLERWSEASPPANMREIWGRWERVHTVRTILWMGTFALETVAAGAVGNG
jgi:uncharacterized membrane protein